MEKNKIVERLIEDDVKDILQHNCTSLLDDILRRGFVGYDNMDIEELNYHYQDRFGEETTK